MATHKELEELIKQQEIEKEIKDAEIWLLKSEIVDTLKPITLLSEQSGLLLEMLEEYIEHFKNRKETEKNKQSKLRLVRLLFISDELSILSGHNKSLQTSNNHLQAKNRRVVQVARELQIEINRQQSINMF